MSAPTLEPYQCWFNGHLAGPGTTTQWAAWDGLDGFAARFEDRPAPGFDGSIPSLMYAEPRQVILTFELEGTPESGQGSRKSFLTAYSRQVVSATEFHWYEPAYGQRMIRARSVRTSSQPHTVDSEAGILTVSVVLRADDPYIYGTQVHSVPIPVYSISGGGVDLPDDLPFDLGAATEQHGVAVNAGNADAYPLVRIQRPAGSVGTFTGFTLTNTTTDDDPVEMVVNLSAGQTLFMDFFAYVRAERGVDPIRIDNASRFSGWQHPRTPLRIAPPGANFLRLDVDGTATDTVALATYRDTSL